MSPSPEEFATVRLARLCRACAGRGVHTNYVEIVASSGVVGVVMWVGRRRRGRWDVGDRRRGRGVVRGATALGYGFVRGATAQQHNIGGRRRGLGDVRGATALGWGWEHMSTLPDPRRD